MFYNPMDKVQYHKLGFLASANGSDNTTNWYNESIIHDTPENHNKQKIQSATLRHFNTLYVFENHFIQNSKSLIKYFLFALCKNFLQR